MSNNAQTWALLEAIERAKSEFYVSNGDHSGARQKALAHLAPFFAQGVHSGTVATKGHAAENHGTDVTELDKLRNTVDLAKRVLAACDQQLESEFGGFYLSAPDDEPLGKVRRMLRGEAAP